MIIQGRQREQCQALNLASQAQEGKELQQNNNKRKMNVNTLAEHYHKSPCLFGKFNYHSKCWVCHYKMLFQSTCYYLPIYD